MEPFRDYYSLLQVHCDAEQDIVDATYRKLCKKYHPDVCTLPNAEERMKEINLAYEVLGDEARRSDYNAQYKVRNQWFSASRTIAEDVPGKLLSSYMLSISSGLYHDAYELLSDTDKKYIEMEKFVRWQRLVAAVYGVESFELKASKKFDEHIIDKGISVRAVRFDVEVNEQNKLAETYRRYTIKKFVVEENGQWRVYLGYKNLTEIMKELQYLVDCQNNPGLISEWRHYRAGRDSVTGLYNRAGLLERAEPEVYRFDRYRQSFYVAVMQVRTKKTTSASLLSKSAVQVGSSIKNSLRKGDVLGCIAPGRFGMVLLNIQGRSCSAVLKRIAARCSRDCMAMLDTEVIIAGSFCEYKGDGLDNTLLKCERKLKEI